MDIQSQGKMTAESVKTLVRYLSKNEKLLVEASKLAKTNLPAFMGKAFDIPEENMRALRKIMTPHFSGLLVDFMLDSIRNDADVEIIAEPAIPTPEGEVTLAVSMEVSASSGNGIGGPTKLRVRCRPDDGTGHPIPR